MITQHRSNRTVSGARYKDYRRKRLFEKGNVATLTKVSEKNSVASERGRARNFKYKLLGAGIANVLDPKTKKIAKSKIKTVVENPSNRHFVRRNIITCGTVIDTELGKAKVTNRPGQEGHINAVLV